MKENNPCESQNNSQNPSKQQEQKSNQKQSTTFAQDLYPQITDEEMQKVTHSKQLQHQGAYYLKHEQHEYPHSDYTQPHTMGQGWGNYGGNQWGPVVYSNHFGQGFLNYTGHHPQYQHYPQHERQFHPWAHQNWNYPHQSEGFSVNQGFSYSPNINEPLHMQGQDNRQFYHQQPIKPGCRRFGKGRGGCDGNWGKYRKNENECGKKSHEKKWRNHKSRSKSNKKNQKDWKKQRKYCQKQEKNEEKLVCDGQNSDISSDQFEQLEAEMNEMSITKQKQKQKIIQQFIPIMEPFFEKYKVPAGIKHQTINFLIKRFKKAEELDLLISCLYELENDPEIVSSLQFFTFLAITRMIYNKSYDISVIKQKILKKKKSKIKKIAHDTEFNQKYPEPAYIEFLQLNGLLQIDRTKTVFLIDSNNIMQRQKHFRSYFEHADANIKAEGQIRLMWLLSLTGLKAEIFFDRQYSPELYKQIKDKLMSQAQQQRLSQIPCHFPDKKDNPDKTADDELVDRLINIVSNDQYPNHDIVLVSADRGLGQQCMKICEIKKTSGLYIFKYCKRVIKENNMQNKQMKETIKQIFNFCRSDKQY